MWAATLLAASCASQPAKLPPPPPEPPPPPPRAVRPMVHAGWSFQTSSDACIAVAASGRTKVEVTVRRKTPIRLSVALATATAATGNPVAHFHGPAGTWAIRGGHAGDRELMFVMGHDEASLSRVLMLLSGGVLDLQSPDKDLPVITLMESGADGQRWFRCARGIVI